MRDNCVLLEFCCIFSHDCDSMYVRLFALLFDYHFIAPLHDFHMIANRLQTVRVLFSSLFFFFENIPPHGDAFAWKRTCCVWCLQLQRFSARHLLWASELVFISSQQAEGCLPLFIAVPASVIKNAGYSACLRRHGEEINHHHPGSTIVCFCHEAYLL